MPMTDLDIVTTARSLVDASQRVIDAVLARIAEVTEGGAGIDDNQVQVERVAYLATQVRAAGELVASVEELREADARDAQQEGAALVYAAEATHALRSAIELTRDDLSVDAVAELDSPEFRNAPCVDFTLPGGN